MKDLTEKQNLVLETIKNNQGIGICTLNRLTGISITELNMITNAIYLVQDDKGRLFTMDFFYPELPKVEKLESNQRKGKLLDAVVMRIH